MAELSKVVVPPETPYIDAVLSFWKLIVFEYFPKLVELHLAYSKVKGEIGNVEKQSIANEYSDVFKAYASTMLSLIASIAPYVLYVYYTDENRFKRFPDDVQDWVIELVTDESKSWIKSFEVRNPIEEYPPSEVLEDIKTVGLILAEVGLISPKELMQ